MRELTPAERRLQEFHRRQRMPLGVPAGDRTLAASNALSHWFATGEVLDSLDLADRALIDLIQAPDLLPEPKNLLDRLQQTLYLFREEPSDADVFGGGVRTGLTWGDLRTIQEYVRLGARENGLDGDLGPRSMWP